ncbi:MAG: ATP-binding protein [Candidatus Neomarinimicrobiota bacterium]
MKRRMRQEVAQHKQTIKQLQKYCDQLEELLKERTSELKTINEKFQQEIADRKQAEKELGDLERRQLEAEKIIALGQVAAGVAHEINNPLASIKNCFHIVKGALPRGQGMEQFIRFIDADIERISAIVREMYNLYQPPHAAVGPISVNEVFGDVLAAMEGAMSAYAVELQDERCAGELEVALPSGQLAQIFTNLINNALDAMPDGGYLRVKTSKQKEQILVEIADTGAGIPSDVLPHIFEPFFSTKSPAVGKGVKMGLGLSVTRSLVNSLGGHIGVKTAPGAGTCVTVSLPIESYAESKGDTSHD